MRVKTIFAIFLVALNGSASNAMTCMEALQKANVAMRSCRTVRRWYSYTNRCYLFVLHELNWFEAQEYCEALGSRLSEVYNEQLNEWIVTHIETIDGNGYWLGGNDIKNEGRWRWVVDNSPFSYTNWVRRIFDPQPDGARRENCLSTYFGGSWYDSNCYLMKKFVCVN